MEAIGIPLLAISLGIPLTAVFGWFRRRDESLDGAQVDTYSHPTGTPPRTSFGMRNR